MSAKNNSAFTDMMQRMAVLGMLPAAYSSSPKPKARAAKPKPGRIEANAIIAKFENKLRLDGKLTMRDFLGPDGEFDLKLIHVYLVDDVRPPSLASRVVTDAVITRLEKKLAAVPDHQFDDLNMSVFYEEGSLRHLDPEKVFRYLDHDIAPPPRVYEEDTRTQEEIDREFDQAREAEERQAEAEDEARRKAEEAADIVAEPVPLAERKLLAAPAPVVRDAVEAEPAPEIEQVLPVGNTPTDEDLLAAGVVTMQRINRWRQREWNDWLPSGAALLAAQRIVVREAGSNTGMFEKKHNTAFGVKLKKVGFVIMPNERSTLIAIMKVLPAVEAWRATLTDADRQRWNSPVTVWQKFRKAQQPARPKVVRPPDPAKLLAIENEVRAQTLSRLFEFAREKEIDLPTSEAMVDDEIAAKLKELAMPVEVAEAA